MIARAEYTLSLTADELRIVWECVADMADDPGESDLLRAQAEQIIAKVERVEQTQVTPH